MGDVQDDDEAGVGAERKRGFDEARGMLPYHPSYPSYKLLYHPSYKLLYHPSYIVCVYTHTHTFLSHAHTHTHTPHYSSVLVHKYDVCPMKRPFTPFHSHANPPHRVC